MAQNIFAMLTALPAKDFILFCVLLISAYTDIKKGLIYNIILVPAAVTALILHFVQSGVSGIIFSLQGLLLGAGLLLIPFIKGGIGAGDMKLLGVVGALKGPLFAAKVFLVSALAGGVIAVILLLKIHRLVVTLKAIYINICFFFTHLPRLDFFGTLKDADQNVKFPYGIAIALGTLIVYFGI